MRCIGCGNTEVFIKTSAAAMRIRYTYDEKNNSQNVIEDIDLDDFPIEIECGTCRLTLPPSAFEEDPKLEELMCDKIGYYLPDFGLRANTGKIVGNFYLDSRTSALYLKLRRILTAESTKELPELLADEDERVRFAAEEKYNFLKQRTGGK